ncbi:hypothetical protein Tco_1325761 [Tanacetum coccineum]
MMMNLGTPTLEPLVNSFVFEESDDDMEVTPAYTPPLPFLTTMEPADTLLIGDEDSSTTPTRETDKFIKSSAMAKKLESNGETETRTFWSGTEQA